MTLRQRMKLAIKDGRKALKYESELDVFRYFSEDIVEGLANIAKEELPITSAALYELNQQYASADISERAAYKIGYKVARIFN